jgi:hypothetical protein
MGLKCESTVDTAPNLKGGIFLNFKVIAIYLNASPDSVFAIPME